MEGKYFFNGKDINMNMCIQIRDVIDIIKATTGLNFPDATLAFYESKTYKALQNTDNTLWAESAGYKRNRTRAFRHSKRLPVLHQMRGCLRAV